MKNKTTILYSICIIMSKYVEGYMYITNWNFVWIIFELKTLYLVCYIYITRSYYKASELKNMLSLSNGRQLQVASH